MSTAMEIAAVELTPTQQTLCATGADGDVEQGTVGRAQPSEREYDTVLVDSLDTRYASMRLARPTAVSALRSSMARHGVLHPLVVNREGDALVVLDGFKRLSILREKPDAMAPVRVVSLSPTQAMAALVTFNRPHRGLCELEEAWIVQALVREHGLLQVEVARLLARHKSWICRRLQLVELLEPGVVEDMRLGLVSASVARELVRLPRGNQPLAAETISRHGLTSRQSSELVARLLDCDDDQSHRDLLDDPLRQLASASSRPARRCDAHLCEAEDELRKSLIALQKQAKVAGSLLRSWLSAPRLAGDLDLIAGPLSEVFETMQETSGIFLEILDVNDDGSER